MDITRVSAISPVIRTSSFKSKESKTYEKRKEEKKAKEFEKTLKSKRAGEIGYDVYN